MKKIATLLGLVLAFGAIATFAQDGNQPKPEGFPGGRHGKMRGHHGGPGRMFEALGLSDAQKEQIKTILENGRKNNTDPKDVHAQVEAVFTAEQKAKFEEMKKNHPAPREGFRGGPRGGGPGRMFEALGLTDAQKEQIKTIFENGRKNNTDPKDVHDQIDAVLTDEQKAKRQEMFKNHPAPPFGEFGRMKGDHRGGPDKMFADLGLSDAQKEQIKAIFENGRKNNTDRAEVRNQIEKVLTDEQKAKLKERKGKRGHFPPTPPQQ